MAPLSEDDLFGRLLEILLPDGGYVMALYEAYFDESGCDDGSKVLVVGGYLVQSRLAKAMDKKWRRVLRYYNVPYFHMVDCAHGNRGFKHLSKDQRIAMATAMIALIKQYTACGFAAIVPPHRFEADDEIQDAYTFCVHACVLFMTTVLPTHFDRDGKIAAFFESGHASQPRADTYMKRPPLSASSMAKHFSSHTFAKKTDVRLLQAADLLVWQWAKYIKDKAFNGRKTRGDFQSLMDHRNAVMFGVTHGKKVLLVVDEHPHVANKWRDQIIIELFTHQEVSDKALRAFYAEPHPSGSPPS